MVGGRDGTLVLVLEDAIDVFSRDDFGLFGLFVEGGERQGFAFIEDRDILVGIQGNSDGGFAHGVGGAIELDLIDDLSELEGQIGGEDPGFAPGEDP